MDYSPKKINATIKLVNGEVVQGTLEYLPNKHYRFKAIDDPYIGFEFHRTAVLGPITQPIVDSNVVGFQVFDSYINQLEEQIAINDLPSA
jgi:hypothetical protein